MDLLREPKLVTLWHGGRGLHYNYKEPKPSLKGRWEHGPGLYLTTHYETARKYAKSGGTTYQVVLELGNHIDDIDLHIDDVLNFVKNNVIKAKQERMISDIHQNIKRLDSLPYIKASYIVNLCINHEALKGDKTLALNRFLVEHDIDYGTVENFGGRNETVCVVYNLAKIKKVNVLRAKDVNLNEYELNFPKRNIQSKFSIK